MQIAIHLEHFILLMCELMFYLAFAVGFVVERQVESIHGLLLPVTVVGDSKKMILIKLSVQRRTGGVIFTIITAIKLTQIHISLKLS